MHFHKVDGYGKRLSQTKKAGMTDGEWAATLGISRQTWSTYVNEVALPSIGVLIKIAEATSYNIDWILFGDGHPQGHLDSSKLMTAIKGTMSLVEAARKQNRVHAMDDIVAMVAGLYEDMIKSPVDGDNSHARISIPLNIEDAANAKHRKSRA